LINAFNRWKTSESAGRMFMVAPDGTTTKQVTGLSWRTEVSAQVFEEAAVDLGRAKQEGPSGRDGIRVGEGHPRSVILPKIGTIRVHDDTRRLRRMLRPIKHLDPHPGEAVAAPRARVLSATVIRRVDRW
jgi:putative transposase